MREPDKKKLKNTIEWILRKNPASIADFLLRLQKDKVSGIVHRNDKGFVYGITFIDHRSKSIFKGSDIGKSYSASAIQDRIAKGLNPKENAVSTLLQKQGATHSLLQKKELSKSKNEPSKEIEHQPDKTKYDNNMSRQKDVLDLLLKTEKNDNRLPYDLLRKKKKRRRLNL